MSKLQEYPEEDYKVDVTYDMEEAWVYATTSNADEVIQKYGVDFFIEKLPRYSKIALLAWKQKNVNTG